MKRAIKWIFVILLTPIILIVLLAVSLYLPPVQNWAVDKVAEYASEETGYDIKVGHVCLVWPLDLGVDEVYVTKPNDSLSNKRDTIIGIEHLIADVKLRPLFDGDVQIDEFNLQGVKLNTIDFIPQAIVRGSLKELTLQSHSIHLIKEIAHLDDVFFANANLDIALQDTIIEDTTETENKWQINLQRLRGTNSHVTLHMPGDTLQVGVKIGDVIAEKGHFDLGKALYELNVLDLKNGALSYDNNFEPHKAIFYLNEKSGLNDGLDINHIAMDSINLSVDSVFFSDPDVRLNIKEFSFAEKSGLALERMKARLFVNTTAFNTENPGVIDAVVDATLAKTALTKAPLNLICNAHGNLQRVNISTLGVNLPGAFNLKGSGFASNPLDFDHLISKIHIDAQTYNGSFFKRFIPREYSKTVNIPAFALKSDIDIKGHDYAVVFDMKEGRSRVNGNGKYNLDSKTYNATLYANNFQLSHFYKGLNIGTLTADASIKGKGFDVQSAATSILANANIKQLSYDRYDLSNVKLDAKLSGGVVKADIDSRNKNLSGVMTVEALMSKKNIRGTLAGEIYKADLYALGFTDQPMTVSVCAHVDVESDLNETHKLQALLGDITIIDSVRTYRPDDVVADLFTRRDSTHAVMDCGDFHLNADANGGYIYLMNVTDRIMKETGRQWQGRIIDEHSLRAVLPTGHIYLSSGRNNPVARAVQYFDADFDNVFINLTSSPEAGLNGEMYIDTLIAKDIQLDRIELKLASDEETINYDLLVKNGEDNPQYTFAANMKGAVLPNGVSAWLGLDDDHGQRGVELSMAAKMEDEGIRLAFDKKSQILGYKKFKVNDDNYAFFSNNMRLSADMKLQSSDGMGIQISTDDENAEALQDVTISLHKFEIEDLLSVLPYTPDLSGTLNGDFHAIITPENLSVSSDVALNNLVFEKSPVGNVSSEFVYIPQEDGSHRIDGIIYKEGEEVGALVGEYSPEGEGSVDATMQMHDFPLDMVNGFIPDQIIGLNGTGEGELSIVGPLSRLLINGTLNTKQASLVSIPYGVKMRFDDAPIKIENSRMLLDNFAMYANNDQPLRCNGYIDFLNLDHIRTDITMKARDFLLVDAKESRRSEAYGKAYVNFDARMTGELSNLVVRGNIDVLSKTDLYYILRDSPITTDNRLKELVTFTDFEEDAPIATEKPTVEGLNVDMKVNVADGSHVKCWLNTNHSNYVDILAGGNLRMMMHDDDIDVVGRCTISEGEMKYSMPIIPLKTFKIKEGSYIEFTGDMMNPRLNISASETNKATVNIDGVNQTVTFDCGVVISKTLNDMGLEFTIDAPENQTVSDELKVKSVEERGKLAVTMLTTGMYLSEDNTSSFTMNNALTSFLQSEINQLAGSALRTLDLSVGLENSTDETGQMHTDYSFKFAKRFWNNRFSISVGGKISTGPDVSGQNSTFFDNIEMQYRLSDTSNQYLQVFYKKAVYDFLEGYVGQYGAGYIWKRNVQSLKDIFRTPKIGKITTDTQNVSSGNE